MKKCKMKVAIFALCLAVVMLFSGCEMLYELDAMLGYDPYSDAPTGEPDGRLTLEFLYVGQADCTLILLPSGETMLVDGGNDGDGEDIADYLSGRGIERLDHVICTHPHEDHVGGLDKILNVLDAGRVYMPELPSSVEPDTRNFDDFLAAAEYYGGVTYLAAGDRVYEGQGLTVDCLSPDPQDVFSDLNNYSIVLKLTYGEDEILLMGDAEQTAEDILLMGGYDLEADLLKAGHHGSSTSSGAQFIRAVEPDYAIISCGVENSYGFPHEETMEILDEVDAEIYVMSEVGSVIATTDGDGIMIETDPTLNLDVG